MKILQINSVCGVGSTGRIATDLYKVLEEQGHECKIAYGRGTSPEGIDSIKIGSKIDNYMHVFKTRVFDKHGFGSVNATKKLIEEVKKYDPDIIHLHNIHGYYINIEILFNYLKQSNKPIIWTLHDCWAFTGHCAYFDFVKCDKWKYKCSECPQKLGYPASNLADNSKLNYEKKKEAFTSVKNMTIVTPSRWLANLVRESFLGKYEIEVINNGIDLNTFKPTDSNFRNKYNIKERFLVLGVASNWDDRKGLKYLVDLETKLNDEYKIVVVGVTEKQQRQLPNRITAITRTNDVKELVDIYSAADVFINPTLEDNFPTTNLESIACGTPVITFDTGGSPECIDDTCGLVVKKEDTESLYNTMLKICEDNIFNIENCLKRSMLFDSKNKYIKYIDIYGELLNGKKI